MENLNFFAQRSEAKVFKCGLAKIPNAAGGCKAGRQKKLFSYHTYQTCLDKFTVKLLRIELKTVSNHYTLSKLIELSE